MPELMYLAEGQWSPRYEDTFFTIRMMKEPPRWVTSSDADDNDSIAMVGNRQLPAYYYAIVVCRGHDQRIVTRRYSQFHWLYQQLRSNHELSMPPGSCPFVPQSQTFARERQKQLKEFLDAVLTSSPAAANHPAVKHFLGLFS